MVTFVRCACATISVVMQVVRVLAIVATLVLPGAALRMPPPALSRRSAVFAGASILPAFVLPANAGIEDIAARANAQADVERVAKEKDKADKKVRPQVRVSATAHLAAQ